MPSLLVALAAATGAATTTKHLLLSPRVVDPTVATAAGAALELGRTTPHAANPLFTDADAGKGQWEGEYSNMWASVYWDRGKYRLWYNSYLNCSGVTPGTGCVGVGAKARANGLEYAESTTGLRWRFPTQRTTAFNGSADNNLQMLITTCGTSVLLDSPDARCALPDGSGNTVPCPYKLVGDLASSAAFAVSADGRRVQQRSAPVISPRASDADGCCQQDMAPPVWQLIQAAEEAGADIRARHAQQCRLGRHEAALDRLRPPRQHARAAGGRGGEQRPKLPRRYRWQRLGRPAEDHHRTGRRVAVQHHAGSDGRARRARRQHGPV